MSRLLNPFFRRLDYERQKKIFSQEKELKEALGVWLHDIDLLDDFENLRWVIFVALDPGTMTRPSFWDIGL